MKEYDDIVKVVLLVGFLLFLAGLGLYSVKKDYDRREKEYADKTPEEKLNVQLLLDYDGCKVYQFNINRYERGLFTTCEGDVSWSKLVGKTRVTVHNSTGMVDSVKRSDQSTGERRGRTGLFDSVDLGKGE